jgi:hypothetical protein
MLGEFYLGNTEKNIEYLQSLKIINASEMEKAEADKVAGARIHYSKGVWWQEAKPFFYLPVNTLRPINPIESNPKFWLSWGGYYHIVSDKSLGNGTIVVNEINDPSGFSLNNLTKGTRYEIRKGLANLEIRQITNLERLVSEGYQLYLSWLTRNPYKKQPAGEFRTWIIKMFHHPYNLLLGAFYENQLVAFVIADAIENVGYFRYSYSHSAFNNFFPQSVLSYAYITICAQNKAIKKITNGFRSQKPSLDKFKSKFGYNYISYPAFIKINPLLQPIIKLLMPVEYKRLMGQYQE